MKGGRTPIHVQKWCPADFQADPHVKLLLKRRDYLTLAFYRQFLDVSFSQGGDLPADIEELSACLSMPDRDCRKALEFCLGRLIVQEGDRLYQKRVRAEVAAELEFRSTQSAHGKNGGRPRKERVAFFEEKGKVSESKTPPTPNALSFVTPIHPLPLPISEPEGKGEVPASPEPGARSAGDQAAERRAREAEIAWRIERVWEAHVRAWAAYREERDGRRPGRPPTLHPDDIRKPIREALLLYDRNLLSPEDRARWQRESRVRAAGVGIFYDPWCTAQDPGNNRVEGGREYLEHWRPWRRQRGKADPVERFAELYFAVRDARDDEEGLRHGNGGNGGNGNGREGKPVDGGAAAGPPLLRLSPSPGGLGVGRVAPHPAHAGDALRQSQGGTRGEGGGGVAH